MPDLEPYASFTANLLPVDLAFELRWHKRTGGYRWTSDAGYQAGRVNVSLFRLAPFPRNSITIANVLHEIPASLGRSTGLQSIFSLIGRIETIPEEFRSTAHLLADGTSLTDRHARTLVAAAAWDKLYYRWSLFARRPEKDAWKSKLTIVRLAPA